MKNKILFWLFFILAVLLAIYISVRIAMLAIGAGGPVSVIKKVSIYASDGNVENIASAVNIAPGTKTRALNLENAVSAVQADPDVAAASVRRMPNGNIKIKAGMRRVVAAWTDGEKFYPMDENGTPINRPLESRPNGVLIFSGKISRDVSDISHTVKSAPELFYKTDRLELIEDRRWNIILLSGMTIMLPEENQDEAIKMLAKMQKQNGILDREIKVLDLRDIARPLVKVK